MFLRAVICLACVVVMAGITRPAQARRHHAPRSRSMAGPDGPCFEGLKSSDCSFRYMGKGNHLLVSEQYIQRVIRERNWRVSKKRPPPSTYFIELCCGGKVSYITLPRSRKHSPCSKRAKKSECSFRYMGKGIHFTVSKHYLSKVFGGKGWTVSKKRPPSSIYFIELCCDGRVSYMLSAKASRWMKK